MRFSEADIVNFLTSLYPDIPSIFFETRLDTETVKDINNLCKRKLSARLLPILMRNEKEAQKLRKLNDKSVVEYFQIRNVSYELFEELYIGRRDATPECAGYWINSGYLDSKASELASKVYYKKTTAKEVKSNVSESGWNLSFWLGRGYSEEEARKKVSELQAGNSRKYCALPKEFRRSKATACLEYYIARGYSEEEAKKLRSERQSTFTLQKCIEKYGEDQGREVFRKRQEKWQTTLINREDYEEVKKKRNIFDIENLTRIHGEEVAKENCSFIKQESHL